MGRKNSKICFIFFFLCLNILDQASASPWLRNQGDGIFITRAEEFRSDKFRQLASMAYLEYGLTDSLMLGGKLTYASQQYGGAFSATATGFTAAEIFAQREISRSDQAITSFRVTYAAPTEAERRVQVPVARFNPINYGNALEGAILYGRNLSDDGKVFWSMQAGYRASLGADADQVRTEIVTGLKPGANWLLLLKSNNTISIDNGSVTGVDYDVYRLEPAISYRRSNGRSYTIGSTVDLGGRNIETGIAVFFSLWNEF